MKSSLPDEIAQVVALLTSEWFKTSRRLSRLTKDVAPARMDRERAQLNYSQTRVEAALGELGVRLLTHEGSVFSAEIPAEPVNVEDFDSEDGLVVQETLEPTVVHDGRIISRGLIVLARGA